MTKRASCARLQPLPTKRRPDVAPVGLTEIQMRITLMIPTLSCATSPRRVQTRLSRPPPSTSVYPGSGRQRLSYRIAQGLLRAFQIGRRRNPLPKSTSRSCPRVAGHTASATQRVRRLPRRGRPGIAFYPRRRQIPLTRSAASFRGKGPPRATVRNRRRIRRLYRHRAPARVRRSSRDVPLVSARFVPVYPGDTKRVTPRLIQYPTGCSASHNHKIRPKLGIPDSFMRRLSSRVRAAWRVTPAWCPFRRHQTKLYAGHTIARRKLQNGWCRD